MSNRKPPKVTWESWIDQQIRAGIEQGAFDNLPGQGKPIPDLDRPRDELWWIKDKLRREDLTLLPPALALRKERDLALDEVERAANEQQVRDIVDAINEKIRALNRAPIDGPPSDLVPLDVDAVIARWRARRESA